MKTLITLILLTITLGMNSQHEISIEINAAKYKVETSSFYLDLSIKNHTDSTIYIITPKNVFFENHYDESNLAGAYGLNELPYKLSISTNKKCNLKKEEKDIVSRIEDPSLIYDQMIAIKPQEVKVFNTIKLDISSASFCKDMDYKIAVSYKPVVYEIDKERIDQFKEKKQSIKEDTRELNKLLYKDLRSYVGYHDQFKKLEQLVDNLPSTIALNNKTFESKKTTAQPIN